MSQNQFRDLFNEGINPQQFSPYNPQSLQTLYNQFLGWYQGLPKVGQVAVAIMGLIMGLTLLKIVFQLVSLLVSLAVLAVLLYLAYRFLIAPKSSNLN